MEEYKGSPSLDAGLLAAAQAVQHYEISRQGTHRDQTEEHVARLEDVLEVIDKKPVGKTCQAIMGGPGGTSARLPFRWPPGREAEEISPSSG